MKALSPSTGTPKENNFVSKVLYYFVSEKRKYPHTYIFLSADCSQLLIKKKIVPTKQSQKNKDKMKLPHFNQLESI